MLTKTSLLPPSAWLFINGTLLLSFLYRCITLVLTHKEQAPIAITHSTHLKDTCLSRKQVTVLTQGLEQAPKGIRLQSLQWDGMHMHLTWLEPPATAHTWLQWWNTHTRLSTLINHRDSASRHSVELSYEAIT